MTVALATRGVICHTGFNTLSLFTRGLLCPAAEVGAVIPVLLPECTYVYNKQSPQIIDPSTVGLFSIPAIQLTGQKSPLLGSSRPSLVSRTGPTLYNPSAAQLTGSKVITVVGNKNLLLSEPKEPTLTSSGTRAPNIFDKDC